MAAVADPVAIAQGILLFDEDKGNPYALLSTGPTGLLAAVGPSNTPEEIRGNYRRLAAIIHPDRLKRSFDNATEAFQKLVRIFEMACDPTYKARCLRAAAAAAPTANKKMKKASTAAAAAAGGKKSTTAAKGIEDKKKPSAKRISASSPTLAITGSAAGTEGPTKKTKAPAKKRATAKKKRGADSEDDEVEDEDEDDGFLVMDSAAEDTEEEEEEEMDEDDEWPGDGGGAVVPYEQDLGLKPRGPRDNGGCFKTPIACPSCRDPWQPDDLRHYVLLMAYGVRVFCSTCLFQFGPASALHYCPFCKRNVDYDVSEYDKKVTCGHCHKGYGFLSCPVTDRQLVDVREKIREEVAARQKRDERARRAAARNGGVTAPVALSTSSRSLAVVPVAVASGDGAEALDQAIGQAIVMGACPLCQASVRGAKAAHAHVTSCFQAKNGGSGNTAVVVASPTKKRTPASATPKKDKAATGGTLAKKPTPKKAVKAPAEKKKKEVKKRDTSKTSKTSTSKKKATATAGKKRARSESTADSVSSSDNNSSSMSSSYDDSDSSSDYASSSD